MPIVHGGSATHPARQAALEVPADFVADRLYVRLRTLSGGLLTLYSDSGGGALIISRAAAARLHLPMHPIDDPDAKAELGPDAAVTVPPKLARGLPSLPARAFVVPRASQAPGWPEQGDGFVGAKWFGRGTWTWDYAQGRFWYRPSLPANCPRSIALGFKTDAAGARPTNFARISVMIDGRALPMLLDTGAETLLTDAARSQIGDGLPAMRATSMLQASIFDALHRAHPDWRFIDEGQVATKASMLRVPSLMIGTVKTGPVWLTRRPDANYEKFMSSMMDRPVVGSIGGNALHGLVLTVDYKASRAWIEQPDASCFAPSRRHGAGSRTSAIAGSRAAPVVEPMP